MRTNWKKVGIEIEIMKIPDHVKEAFEADGDAGAFRNACREFNVSEEGIDAAIKEWKID